MVKEKSRTAKMHGANQLIDALLNTFIDPALFQHRYVNERQYLRLYRLHSRVCGLLARAGLSLGYLVDINRRYTIDPIQSASGRKQHQAEADVSYVDPDTDRPLVILDYESSDAHLKKISHKFEYLGTFRKHTTTIQAMVLLITVTKVHHG